MKRILITPLDWGLGHATRCIPVVRELLQRNCEVLLAGSGDSLQLLKHEFPGLKSFDITGYSPKYPKNSSMVWSMATQLPKFMSAIRNEHQEIEHIIKENRIDLVISDNRYGAWTKLIPCIFITHQSNILMPKRFGWLSSWVHHQNFRYMKKFTRCWIPDWPGEYTLAGKLINFGQIGEGIDIDFIGALSRFKFSGDAEKKYDVTAIFSGPEPQRSIFENVVTRQLRSSGLRYFIIRGVVSESVSAENEVNYLTSGQLQKVIESSAVIVARSGYSTVMDMAALRKNVIFVPTPGQTEQEYLASQLMEKKIAWMVRQEDFNLSDALVRVKSFSGFVNTYQDSSLLPLAVDRALRLE